MGIESIHDSRDGDWDVGLFLIFIGVFKTKQKISAIGFLSYDMKNILYPHINFKSLKSNFPYMWFGRPKTIKEYKIDSKLELINDIKFFLKNILYLFLIFLIQIVQGYHRLMIWAWLLLT